MREVFLRVFQGVGSKNVLKQKPGVASMRTNMILFGFRRMG